MLRAHQRSHGELHPLIGTAMHNMGVVYLRAGHHQDALNCFDRAVRVRKGAMGRDHPDVAVSFGNEGKPQVFASFSLPSNHTNNFEPLLFKTYL